MILKHILRIPNTTAVTLVVGVFLTVQSPAAASGSDISSQTLAELGHAARQNRAACGPLAVWYVLTRLGYQADESQLVAAAGLKEDGTPIRRVLELLVEHNCSPRAIVTDKARLSLLPVPSILIVDNASHCIVYDGMDDREKRARIFEATVKEVQWVSLASLKHRWDGEAIILDRPRPSLPASVAVFVLSAACIVTPVACFAFRRKITSRASRSGFTLTELLLTIAIVGILLAVLLPAIQHAREASRATHCRSNLRQIGVAVHNYESQYHVFPVAVHWKPAGEPLGRSIAAPGSIDRISLGLATPAEPDRLYANWAIALLPFLGETALYDAFDLAKPVGDAVNEQACATELPIMNCPTDAWGTSSNHFQRSGLAAVDGGYARGNYAINGGTNRRCLTRLSRRKINCPDGVSVNGTDLRRDTSQVWGNGVAGVNRAMRAAEFADGLSKTIFIEEIRAGLHALDRRGCWALGFPGSSITACHGLFGNKGPNTGKDAIQGCTETAAYVPDLEQRGMPCLMSRTDPRLEISERATARSMHVDGVHLLMADGSVHFLDDAVDRRLWHNMHDRSHQQPYEF